MQAIDGPYLQIDDLAGMEASAAQAQALGFDGKWAIHPSQVEPLQRIFTPTAEALAQARATLAARSSRPSGPARAPQRSTAR